MKQADLVIGIGSKEVLATLGRTAMSDAAVLPSVASTSLLPMTKSACFIFPSLQLQLLYFKTVRGTRVNEEATDVQTFTLTNVLKYNDS